MVHHHSYESVAHIVAHEKRCKKHENTCIVFTGIYNCRISAEQPYELVRDENTDQYEYNAYHNTPQQGMKKVALAGCIALIFLYDISDGGADSDHCAYGKIKLYTGSTRLSAVIPFEPTAFDIKKVSASIYNDIPTMPSMFCETYFTNNFFIIAIL